MSIKYAILGFLSWKSFTGYELKKLFAEADTLSWSGNSNQIYTTLVALHKEELVSLEVQLQESLPPRKVYTITGKGLSELKSWLLEDPEPPVLKNTFLMQLTWGDLLDPEELDRLLVAYGEKLQTGLLLFRERERRKSSPGRSQREKVLWDLVSENRISFYENELRWTQRAREALAGLKAEQEGSL